MDTEMPNKVVVARWFASFWGASCDLAIVDALAAPDVLLQYSMHNPRRGRPAVKAFMAGFRAASPGFDFRRVGALVADRDIVVVRWEGSGMHAGPAFHDFGIGPLPAGSGRRITLSGHTAVRLESGMIAEEAVWSMERKARLRPITGGLVLGLSASAGQAMVVWKLDRIGRSLGHVVELVAGLQAREIGLKVLTGGIDTASSTGRLVFGIFATLAEFERDLLKKRTLAGLAAARARSRTGGRPRLMTRAKLRTAMTMMADHNNIAGEVAEQLGISVSTLYAYVDGDGRAKPRVPKLLGR